MSASQLTEGNSGHVMAACLGAITPGGGMSTVVEVGLVELCSLKISPIGIALAPLVGVSITAVMGTTRVRIAIDLDDDPRVFELDLLDIAGQLAELPPQLPQPKTEWRST